MKILQDSTGDPISYDALVRAACILGARISKFTRPRETVGVLMPTSVPGAIAFFAVQAAGRVPAMLNFHAGASNLKTACKLAGVKSILTSRRFIRTANLEKIVARIEPVVSFVYLEDLRQLVTPLDWIIAGLRSLFPALMPDQSKPHDIAVILFTSGTTGAPKGVALSHANILANIAQCRAHIPFKLDWIFFNALPIFHAFGLTGGTLLPILSGIKTVLYPSPLDHERIPKVIQESGADVLVSTDTFARLYARAADAEAFIRLKYVILGGERVSETTGHLFAEKSSALVLQGYGATECGPVIAMNQPDANRSGTVGKLLPGMQARLEPGPEAAIGARLLVRGPNVMLGYLDPERQGQVDLMKEKWFDTGDLARMDNDGFITVTGRVKRFARVGAEMVSLEAVEDCARSLWPDGRHAAVAVDLEKGGEEIVLVTDQKGAKRPDFASWARTHDAPQLTTPHRIFVVRKLPLLATGKPDYAALRRVIGRRLAKAKAINHHAKEASGETGRTRSI